MKILKSKKIDAKPSFKSLINNYHLKLKDKKKTHKSNNFADNILLLPLNSKMSTKKVLEVCKTINSAFNIKKYQLIYEIYNHLQRVSPFKNNIYKFY